MSREELPSYNQVPLRSDFFCFCIHSPVRRKGEDHLGPSAGKRSLSGTVSGPCYRLRRPGTDFMAQGGYGRHEGRAAPVRQCDYPLPVSLLCPVLPGGGAGTVPVPGQAVPAGDGTSLSGQWSLRQRSGLRLCGRLSRGSAYCHRPVSERTVLQNRGGTPARFLQQRRTSLYPGRSRRRGIWKRYRGAAPIPGTHCRLPVRRASVPFLPPPRGAPPGQPYCPSIPGRPFSCCLYPLGHRSPILLVEHLRLCTAVLCGHPDAQSGRGSGGPG